MGKTVIKTLPRAAEAAVQTETRAKAKKRTAAPEGHRLGIFASVALAACALVLAFKFAPTHSHPNVGGGKMAVGRTDLSSVDTRINDSISQHMKDAELKSDMMMHARELENERYRDNTGDNNIEATLTLPHEGLGYGVDLESEDSAEQVYQDLYGNSPGVSDTLPADRINARLAKRKWVSENERAERVQFLTNFIRSAYDHGYEVDIDQNLMVVGVRRVNNTQHLSVNQVLDRLAKQGL